MIAFREHPADCIFRSPHAVCTESGTFLPPLLPLPVTRRRGGWVAGSLPAVPRQLGHANGHGIDLLATLRTLYPFD
ncbi:hypothetical protein AG1IA_05986 [Rhizoctonia solani AG-1 IA]|uniref:Uncharacterized protein n=1 Tax=Thanatephorus cucumeris (strain AG1-IA) TaxID=983506 RepID=L8WT52_THACA|nr:hypothetical protein AG1IA_05986 [Rhizoctonia solani AG-1 IA]